ncbi:unnamed protein product [Linum trigynum]|uniref:Uncharacterized protein n=1 Tax=Linum trigynum TaxID=586398 RepID=A0AAV2EIE2_9ROSI
MQQHIAYAEGQPRHQELPPDGEHVSGSERHRGLPAWTGMHVRAVLRQIWRGGVTRLGYRRSHEIWLLCYWRSDEIGMQER